MALVQFLFSVRLVRVRVCVKFCHDFYLYSNWEMTLCFFFHVLYFSMLLPPCIFFMR